MATQRKILEMGSIVMDHTMYVDTLPTVGQSLMTDNFYRFPGGKGSNQAITASRFGGEVRFLGRIGTDTTSKEMQTFLENGKVDMSQMIVSDDTTVGMAIVLVDRQGKNYVVFDPAATLKLTPQDIAQKEHIFVKDDIFVLTMEFCLETVYAAIRMAHKKGMYIILDPLAVPISSFPKDILPMIDFIKPNETEASALTGVSVGDVPTASLALQKLRQAGVKTPAISLGSQGVVVLRDKEIVHIQGYEVEAVDSTGAGDIFIGALAANLSAGKELLFALKTANAAAALSTTVMGAQTSIPTYQQVEQFLQAAGLPKEQVVK